MAPELSRAVRQVTFLLMVLAAAATEVAAVDGRSKLMALGRAGAWSALAVFLGWLVPTPKAGGLPPRIVGLVLLGLAAAAFLVEPLRRRWRWSDDGYPLELQMIFALRNLGLGLAAFAVWPLCLRLTCVVSLFLMLFTVTMTDDPFALVLLGLYSATGSVWLMLVYWAGLRRSLVAPATGVALRVQPVRVQLPWLACLLAVAVVGGALALVAVGPQRAARTLAEWLPTSGGTEDYDPFARGGVNDGDDEVKGDNPRSTGMTETDRFLDSPLPSLYDMANEKYGEQFKPKERERSIALDGRGRVPEGRKPPADNLRPNREFPTARKSPHRPREASDRAARALFEVQGRTPLHVRVTAFDTFDGLAWREATADRQTGWIDKETNSCWMKVRDRTPPGVFAENDTHQFKITSPLGSLLPTPPHLVRFRVGRVDQTEFFAWGPERILRMAQRETPAGVVVETECRTVDPRLLATAPFLPGGKGQGQRYAAPPADLDPEVTALAHRWADALPGGWPQIDAVVRRLRANYSLEPSARVPEDCRDTLAFFLLRSRRGPDYQFATAAAVLLRVLGYPTRLVSGFYVSPEHYDPRNRHTPVVREDLHFWAEVMLASGDWLVIEPTPGYEVLGPNLPWAERAWAVVVRVAIWAWLHAPELGLGLVVLVGTWWRRRELFDLLAVWGWRWFPGRTWQLCVRRVVRLLECRGRRAGRPRRPFQTVNAWLCSTLRTLALDPADLDRLTRMSEWATYAADLDPPWDDAEVRRVCQRVLGEWTVRRWRRGVAKAAESGAAK